MEAQILRYTYWLGVLAVLLAFLWRAANYFGFFLASYVPGTHLGYMSAIKAAVLLLLVSIATSLYLQTKGSRA
jgi:hypothetical protein